MYQSHSHTSNTVDSHLKKKLTVYVIFIIVLKIVYAINIEK
jgi:hypothetical protein